MFAVPIEVKTIAVNSSNDVPIEPFHSKARNYLKKIYFR